MQDRNAPPRRTYTPKPEQINALKALLEQGDSLELARLLGDDGSASLFVGRYTIRDEGMVRETRRYFDTFAWQLHQAGLVLIKSDHKLILETLDGAIKKRAPSPGNFRFASDLPAESLRADIEELIGVRALLEQASVDMATRRFAFLNEDEKTVVRLAVREYGPPVTRRDGTPFLEVFILPVRGYKEARKTLQQQCKHAGLVKTNHTPLYPELLAQARRQPGRYTAKPDFDLRPDMAGEAAVRSVLRKLHDVMLTNEMGIVEDIDTEFLHDFRTALRRTRSLLSQAKGILPEDARSDYQQRFRALGKLTNDLRDMDVYLLAQERYRAMLPTDLQPESEPLFDYLRRQRTIALRRVRNGLATQRHARLTAEWRDFLDEPVSPGSDAPQADIPIVVLARQRLLSQYRELINDGNLILETQDDTLMHPLRIDTKKLRYLLEFFSDILPGAEGAGFLKQLKSLQENLGEFNDLAVQRAYLIHVADELPIQKRANRRTLVVIGVLVDQMILRQTKVRQDFRDIFAAFAAPATQHTVARLLAMNGQTNGQEGKA
ncbi:MAG: CHAD domain-containing protein [Caldilineaceae bacterium]|nr:CHAD domain-containing protein [Caldilineaceae bacterium]